MSNSEVLWRVELSGGTAEKEIYEYPVIHITLLELMLIEIGFVKIECSKYEERGKKQTIRVTARSDRKNMGATLYQTVGTVRCYRADDHVHADQIQQVLNASSNENIG